MMARERDLPGLAIALVLIGIGGGVLLGTSAMSPMAAVFPRTIALAMMVAAALLAMQSLRRRAAREADARPDGSMVRRALLMVSMLAWALLLPVLGFVTTGLAGFVALLAIANHDGWRPGRTLAYLTVALVTVLLAWLLLRQVLNVPLPRGVLF